MPCALHSTQRHDTTLTFTSKIEDAMNLSSDLENGGGTTRMPPSEGPSPFPLATLPSSLSEIPLERGETGASLPTVDEARMNAGVTRRQSTGAFINNRNKTWLCFGIFFVVLLVFMVGLGVGLSNRNIDRGNSGTDTYRKVSVEDLATYLERNGVTASVTIFDYGTPQAQAAQWMANADPRNLALPSQPVSTQQGYHYVTRYVLAVLYFALGGDRSWRASFNFLSADDLCQWRNIRISRSTGALLPVGSLCDYSTGLIHSLYLDGNRLSGTLPSEITQLTTLRELDLNFNYNIEGQIPTDIGKMSLLKKLAITSNRLTGILPTALCDLTFLVDFVVGYNEFVGQLPSCIGQLSNLELFFAANNLLTGPLPTSIGDMTNLQMIWLDDNLLSGDATYGTFDNMLFLEALFLEKNELEGTIDEDFLAKNKFLIEADVSNNDFTGSLPAHLLNFELHPVLRVLDLHNNRLSGELPSNVTHEGLEFLSLYGNSIDGEIPESWAKFSGLYHLDLSSNDLDGPLPEFLGDLTALTYLFLANNTFEPGPIPDSYAQIEGLEELSLKRTGRTGPLPEWMSGLSNLTLLDLDQNDFTGPIPASYGNLINLQFLFLNRNNLNGQVPPSFSQLTNLRALFLERNSLQGQINFLCEMANFNETEGDSDGTEIIAADCRGGVEALIQCTCCKICCVPAFLGQTEDEGLDDEETCHDAVYIANFNPIWENDYKRYSFDFGNATRFIDRDFLN